VWSKAREFYTRWEVATGLTVYVRRYPVAADAEGNLSLVLFRCAQVTTPLPLSLIPDQNPNLNPNPYPYPCPYP